ncbi:MAG: ATP-binding protein, partial [Candidatus Fermentibacteria bacterium]
LAVGRRPVLELKYTDMNNLISEYLRMFRRVISKDIRVGLIEGHELGTVYVDSGQMEQVLMNLCINSRDAMPEGGSITIETENVLITEEYSRTHPVNLQGHFVLVSITDTGCGMSEETCSKIFEPYFTTKGIGMGSGLGLITAFGIIDQHNGFITVKSELGKGSTFKIYLPVAEQCNEKAGTSINSKAAGGTETILLAEDDEAVQRFTIQVLEGYGYTVLPTEDGPKALNILKNHAPDISLAMLAIALPGMGGRDIYDEIQKINPDIRVILTSGYSHNGIHTRTVLNEEIHSICKPYSPDTLLRMVRAVLDE